MAQASPRIERIPRLSCLSWLMGLYAENYQHLVRLFETAGAAVVRLPEPAGVMDRRRVG